MTPEQQEKLECYLGARLGAGSFVVRAVDEIAGAGLSRSVARLSTLVDGQERAFIMLFDDAVSPVPPNRVAEYSAMRSLAGRSEFVVPYAHAMEETGDLLGFPFVVTDLLAGVTNPRDLIKPEYAPHANAIVRESFAVLGRLAAIDAGTVNLGPGGVPSPVDVCGQTIEQWDRLLHDGGVADRPVICAALRRLRRSVPSAPAKVSIVHGDYRIGNFLFDRQGITGLIDWEMVHYGHPLEDLAWAMMPNWEYAARPGLIGGQLTQSEVIETWEAASGLRVERDALEWWRLFCHVKASAIWINGHHKFVTGKTSELMMCMVAYAIPKEESYMIGYLCEERI